MELESCDICGQDSSPLRRLTDPSMIAIAVKMGIEENDLYCNTCYKIMKERHDQLIQFKVTRQTLGTLNTMDLTTQENIQRLSDITLPSATTTTSTSSSRSSSAHTTPRTPKVAARAAAAVKSPRRTGNQNDTIDRLVNRPPRIDKDMIDNIASQSLSLTENVSSQSSGNLGKSMRRLAEAQGNSSDSSQHSLQAPMPKDRPMRKGPRQFGTGRFSPPLNVRAKILSSDMPRVHSG